MPADSTTINLLTASHFRALAAQCRSHSLPILNTEILARIDRRAEEWIERAVAIEELELAIAAE